MKRALGFSVLGAVVLVLSQACGSSDPKGHGKDVRYTPSGDGGDGGDGASSGRGGTANPGGGQDGAAGDGRGGVGATSGTANQGSSGEAGESAAAGSGGEAGATTSECPTGYAECDDDPSTVCEQNIGLITACGDCDTVCTTDNGTPTCEDGKCVYACVDGFDDCNTDGSDGCEADLSAAETCGSCARNCAALGASCAAGKCSDIALQTGLPFGNDNGVNASWTFSPQGLLHIGGYGYNVTRYPLDGMPVLTVWSAANKGTGVQPIVTVGDLVYWGERGTGGDDYTAAVFSKGITADANVQPDLKFVPEWPVTYLRRQGNAFYWFSGGYQSGDPGAWIYTRSVSSTDLDDHGTKIMSVDQGTHDGVTGFNVTTDALYWISTHANSGTAYELRTAPIGGGAPSAVPTVPGGTTAAVSSYYGVPSLVAVGNTIYFNRQTGEAIDGIYSFKTNDAKPTRLVTVANARDFVVDDSYIYYLQQNVAGVFRAPLGGGAGEQISTGSFTKIVGQDSQFVYAMLSSCCASTLHKIIK